MWQHAAMHINGEALKAIRERSGLTQSDLAKTVGIRQPHLSNIEAGRRAASPDVAQRLAEALRIPVVAILAQPPEAA